MKGVVLVIYDGLGLAFPGPGNAFFLADPETFKNLQKTYPHTQLQASGEAVGLPKNEAGNTEVGHINITSGRVVYQSLPRIDLSIADASFFDNKVFIEAINHARTHNGNIHLIGLLGEGSVHASTAHLNALLYLMREQKFNNVYLHIISDGRDSPPQGLKKYLTELEARIQELQVGTIASLMGRYYGMDRDNRWDRIEKAYECLVDGSESTAANWQQAVDQSYARNEYDEFIKPTSFLDSAGKPHPRIQDNDSVIFYNFRIDRPRELTKAFVLDEITNHGNPVTFNRSKKLNNLYFATMTEYEENLPVHVAYPSTEISSTLGEVIASKGLKQLRMAESEKERFVTLYFNGLKNVIFDGEERIIVPSAHVDTYDQKPEMSAYELTEKLITAISSEQYPFIVINYANADMVGHTGNLEAGMKAIKALDECLKKLIESTLQHNYSLIITGDHGNIEEMLDPITNNVSTEHTSNPVPFVLIDSRVKDKPSELLPGVLADIAPTVLALLHIPKPIDMTGRNLLEGISELQSS